MVHGQALLLDFLKAKLLFEYSEQILKLSPKVSFAVLIRTSFFPSGYRVISAVFFISSLFRISPCLLSLRPFVDAVVSISIDQYYLFHQVGSCCELAYVGSLGCNLMNLARILVTLIEFVPLNITDFNSWSRAFLDRISLFVLLLPGAVILVGSTDHALSHLYVIWLEVVFAGYKELANPVCVLSVGGTGLDYSVIWEWWILI